jgi:hypothetical protein
MIVTGWTGPDATAKVHLARAGGKLPAESIDSSLQANTPIRFGRNASDKVESAERQATPQAAGINFEPETERKRVW